MQILAHLLVQEETVDPLDVLDGDLGALPLDRHQVGHGDQLDGVPGTVGVIGPFINYVFIRLDL